MADIHGELPPFDPERLVAVPMRRVEIIAGIRAVRATLKSVGAKIEDRFVASEGRVAMGVYVHFDAMLRRHGSPESNRVFVQGSLENEALLWVMQHNRGDATYAMHELLEAPEGPDAGLVYRATTFSRAAGEIAVLGTQIEPGDFATPDRSLRQIVGLPPVTYSL